ncbi:MAG: glycosyltransferase, partial [Chloroflexota bacterium]|nr:glycosyltransferase [Chloroflexota bacterium]
MPSTDPLPHEVRRLVDERAAARRERDWARADALRDEIAALGWEVQDAAGGSSARPILQSAPVVPLDGPAIVDASLQVAAEEHPDDLERFLRGLGAYPPAASWELIVVDNASGFELDAVLVAAALPVEPVVVRSSERLGWADARTLGLRHSRGRVTILLDTSVEPTGDFVRPLLAAFDDPSVGLAGGWGLTSADGRQFDEAPAGEVDAIEAYCLAVRREALRS